MHVVVVAEEHLPGRADAGSVPSWSSVAEPWISSGTAVAIEPAGGGGVDVGDRRRVRHVDLDGVGVPDVPS